MYLATASSGLIMCQPRKVRLVAVGIYVIVLEALKPQYENMFSCQRLVHDVMTLNHTVVVLIMLGTVIRNALLYNSYHFPSNYC